ncbi:MAG: hypothetical protein K9K79_01840 [Desulfohalobiaceae bacterium]|nr:hypothetical protein [Desulfohalobiaceae bacterium]
MQEDSTFIWKAVSRWGESMTSIVPSNNRENLVQAIEQDPARFRYIDDVICFREVYSEIGDYDKLQRRLATHLRGVFLLIRMFHCCRPADIQSYYDSGLLVLDSSKANDDFRAAFIGNPEFPEITAAHVEAAIEEMAGSYRRNGFIYFGLDDRYLIDNCGNYLIYGSEYVQSLAACIERQIGRSVKPSLRRRGVPTVFAVDMPVEHFTDDELTTLGEVALQAWAYSIAHNTGEVGGIDFAIHLEQNLGPEFISSHYHPECIPDPFSQRVCYRYTNPS